MKFWKHLSVMIEETLPDWRDKFLSYKDLKKQLKKIYPHDEIDKNDRDDDVDCDGRPSKRPRLKDGEKGEINSGDGVVEKEVTDFVKLLEEEIEKFNGFFVDKEEEYVIRLKVLRDRVAELKDSPEELGKVGKEIADFHGEMVLLENYSALNYLGLVKILKKYDKRTGALIRLPFIRKVLQQPFFKTDVLNKLVKQCEAMLDPLFSLKALSASSEDKEDPNDKCGTEEAKQRVINVPEELSEIENMESSYSRAASSALRILKEMRSGSSTISVFSLPPIQGKELEEEVWKKAPSVEQVAK